ncbi:TPA: hypothetical protein ACI4K1_002174 [Enterobacter roggenkampii]|uniref:hypothetical protein n=1 Tax=Enterobacter TaxID=547 RepID=UPI0008A59882|nr:MULTISPECIES: hypothetical protein [Enterobacter]MBN9703195.1 hypothetical protein [Enterobacter roggenkampii]MBS7800813.1 hypothetical protein [Enterobacter roggenkampii]MCC3239340.1 hypothetical protein [Enterobacter cloacae complex sp. 2021EL-01169]MCK7120961.1 hypothetical protein [Enterobacter roggenkampii]MCK7253319.1 hypothetical protein [Enterobacter roggenkampii]
MINDKLIEYAREKIPDEFRSYLNEKNNLQCASFISSTQNELRIMKAHKENTKFSGLKVNGLDDLIIALENFEKENVFVINIRSKLYSFKIYSDENNNTLLGVIILKLKKKTAEEIRFGREILGITTPPPDIEDD